MVAGFELGMGTILTIASSKGGSGKTTLAQCLVANLAKLGYRLTVIDADANATFGEWHTNIYKGPAFGCIGECRQYEAVDIAQAEADKSDVVLIDTGFYSHTVALAIAAADFVLIPTRPDRGSICEAIRTARNVEKLAGAVGYALPYRLIGTQWRDGGLIEGAAFKALADEKMPVLTRTLPNLTAFGEASYTGRVPVSGRAGLEVNAIITELVGLRAIPARKQARRASAVGLGRMREAAGTGEGA
jgi:chromosome partitioning protein